jgi:tyrosinase
LFELQIQRVLSDATVGLPYWDWAADGALPPSGQVGSALWQNSGIGGTGRPVANGPFRASVFRVRIESNAFAALRTTDRGLNRDLGADPDAPSLPTPASEVDTLGQSPYDTAPWSRASLGFRNRLEGWLPFGMHNHCNVDRIWEGWLVNQGRTYVPSQSESAQLAMHRLNDPMYSILISQPTTPAEMLDVSQFYTYDLLPSTA